MLTPRGRTLLALGAALLVTGRVLGLRELVMAGVALLAVVGIGAAAVRLRQTDVAASRTIAPARVRAGQDVRVELTLAGRGSAGSGPVLAVDQLPEALGRSVRLTLEGSRSSGMHRRIAYLVGPRMRGRYRIGPLELLFTDPFGCVQRREAVPGHADLVVYPSYETVSTLPGGAQRLGVVRRSPMLGQGDEFYALRGYQDGDDLRKVHWPSSAKLGHMVIRQEELLAEPRLLVVLDTCATKHRGRGPEASIEAAISAAASVGSLALHRRMRVDVVTPEGTLIRTRRPNEEELLEALAFLEPSDRRDLVPALTGIDPRRSGRAALVVVISPELDRAELGALTRLVAGASGGALVHVDAATFTGAQPARQRPPAAGILGLPVVRLGAGTSFRRAWESGVRDVALAR